jgi:hypothetical protein
MQVEKEAKKRPNEAKLSENLCLLISQTEAKNHAKLVAFRFHYTRKREQKIKTKIRYPPYSYYTVRKKVQKNAGGFLYTRYIMS